ncbi:hypothetical protein MVEN_01284600 [Mycena venus]|uniref:DUF6533 domain-containing protein n=1 Tax=Mycena venus TaxID=2733690 RepID=A0A8H7CVT3_9AGAR|nr:hypothetical protein MVEN_01284600 [Mycena venus]
MNSGFPPSVGDLRLALPNTLIADQRLSHAFFLLAFVVVVYDYLLTFSAEVHFIWLRPKRPSSYWFILNRYLALSTSIAMAIFTFAYFEPETCVTGILQNAQKVFVLIQEIVIFGILGLRVYAMFNLDRRILALLGVTGVAAVAIVAWLSNTDTDPPPPSPATFAYTQSQCATSVFHASAIRLAGAWEAEIVVDVLVFGLTVLRAFQQCRFDEFSSSILGCLVRDGAIAILLANLSNILMYYFGDPVLAGSLSWFAVTLSATLVSRLMLNLHEVADAGIYHTNAGGWEVTQNVVGILPAWGGRRRSSESSDDGTWRESQGEGWGECVVTSSCQPPFHEREAADFEGWTTSNG